MDKKNDLDSSKEFLLNSFDEIVPILKTIGNSNRFKILILLLEGPLNFQTLLDKLNLKKSALANHLTKLKDNGLIRKVHHGTYSLTEDGSTYVKAIENTYKESRKLEIKRKELEKRRNMTMSFLERK
ncbi:MAG TPA: winged helix-turn-helix domain-containing protein [Methanobacterium sp.]|jgi:DNA-binding HxlR family transcriptional regulator|nr:winged helix-turn-helix domain-containing protein [Methanobacterium sp.]HOI39968.1 winged helix-turn-helix domain-containing protein [Methanobacterium sp.]